MLKAKSIQNIQKIIKGNITEDNGILLPEALIILVEEYRIKYHLSCLVCQDGQYISKEKKYENFFSYALCLINGSLINNKIHNGITMTFLVENTGHWTCVQLNVYLGKIYFFIIDAAGTDKADRVIKNIRNIYELKSRKGLFGKIFCSKPKIQKDGLNCSLFSLHHAFKLSKLSDTFDFLRKKEYLFKKDMFYPDLISIVDVKYLHPSLLKGIQDYNILNYYDKSSMFNSTQSFNQLKEKLMSDNINTKFSNPFFVEKRDKFLNLLKVNDINHEQSKFDEYKKYVTMHESNFFKFVSKNSSPSFNQFYYLPDSYETYMNWRKENLEPEI